MYKPVSKYSFVTLIFMLLSIDAYGGVLFQDDLESGNFSHKTNGFYWGGSNGGASGAEKPVISKDISRSGVHSIKFTYKAGASGDDAWSEKRFKLGKNMDSIYLQFYIYYPDGSEGLGARYVQRNDAGADNNKLLRIWDEDYSAYKVKLGFSTYPRSSPTRSTIFGEFAHNRSGMTQGGFPSDGKNGIGANELGRWVRIDIHLTTDKGSGAIMKLWRDGQILVDNVVPNYPNGGTGNYFRNGYLLGWANSGFDKTTHVYIDDFTISDTPIDGGLAPPRAPDLR